jgi:mono/diheme cytochrome c family protein
MTRLKVLIFTFALLIALPVSSQLFGKQQVGEQSQELFDSEDTEFGEVFVLAIGGKLYDNLWTMTATNPPAGANPAFPTELNQPEAETWRCVSCHGWDYRGGKGERRKLGNSPALASLKAMEGVELDRVAERIRTAHPQFPKRTFEDAIIEVLALFISIGQYDHSAYLTEDGIAIGKAEGGREIFEGACMNCHQYDGKATLIGELGDRSSLGWISRNRPEQALHKVLNGVPGTDMLAVRFLTQRQIGDLLAFLQTLDPNGK